MLAKFNPTNASRSNDAVDRIIIDSSVSLYPNLVISTLSGKYIFLLTFNPLTTDLDRNVKSVKQTENSILLNWSVQYLKTGTYYLYISSGDMKIAFQFIK